jgi:hypothetical protein
MNDPNMRTGVTSEEVYDDESGFLYGDEYKAALFDPIDPDPVRNEDSREVSDDIFGAMHRDIADEFESLVDMAGE